MEIFLVLLLLQFVFGLFIMVALKNGHPFLTGFRSIMNLKNKKSQRPFADCVNGAYLVICAFFLLANIFGW